MSSVLRNIHSIEEGHNSLENSSTKTQYILTIFWLLTGGSETGTTLNMIVPRDMAWKMPEGEE